MKIDPDKNHHVIVKDEKGEDKRINFWRGEYLICAICGDKMPEEYFFKRHFHRSINHIRLTSNTVTTIQKRPMKTHDIQIILTYEDKDQEVIETEVTEDQLHEEAAFDQFIKEKAQDGLIKASCCVYASAEELPDWYMECNGKRYYDEQPKLSQRMIDEYVKNPNHCPFCKSNNIEVYDHDSNGCDVICNDCEENWMEELRVVSIFQ